MSNKSWINTILSFIILAFLSFNFANAQEETQEPLNLSSSKEEKPVYRILFRGNLFKTDGSLAEDGLYNMRFKIYSEPVGGEALWEEEFVREERIKVENSKFKVILGRKRPLDFLDFKNNSYFLAIQVGGQSQTPDWDQEMLPRKPIVSLTNYLKDQLLDFSKEDELIAKLEELIGKKENVVLLVDLKELKQILKEIKRNKTRFSQEFGEESLSSQDQPADLGLLGVIKNIFKDLKERILEVFSKVQEAFQAIEEILAKVKQIYTEFSSLLQDISFKVNAIYQVVVQNQNPYLAKKQALEEVVGKDYASSQDQDFGTAIVFAGDKEVKVPSEKVKPESKIFISFQENPNQFWWVKEKVAGKYFVLAFDKEVDKDYKFDWWVFNLPTSASSESKAENVPSQQSQEEISQDQEALSSSGNESQSSKEESEQPSLAEELLKEAEELDTSPPETSSQEGLTSESQVPQEEKVQEESPSSVDEEKSEIPLDSKEESNSSIESQQENQESSQPLEENLQEQNIGQEEVKSGDQKVPLDSQVQGSQEDLESPPPENSPIENIEELKF